jgi:hypothetical protein
VLVHWDWPSFEEGGGNGGTEVYFADYSGTGDLPTFADAALLKVAPSSVNQVVDGLVPNQQRHYWARHVTRFGTPCVTFTGGVNGVVGLTAPFGVLNVRQTGTAFKVQGGASTPLEITITAQGQFLRGAPAFTIDSGTATLTGTGISRTITAASMTTDTLVVRVSWDGEEDLVTLTKLVLPSANVDVPLAPNGLVARGVLKAILLSWNQPTYEGHKKFQVYRSTTNDRTTATLVATPTADVYVDSTATAGLAYYYWVRAVNVNDQTGPFNGAANEGVSAGLALVGTSDLGNAVVLAGNLAPGSVTADKSALEIGGDNLVANNSFEVDVDSDGLADGWGVYNNDGSGVPTAASRTSGRISGFAQRVTWTGTNASSKGVFAPGVRGGWQIGKTYVVSFYARGASAQPFGMSLQWNVSPATTVALKNPNIATTWQRYAFRIIWGGSVENSGNLFLSILYGNAWANGWVEFDDVQVEEGDTLSGYQGKLALNTIVAGDGAVANFAITNLLLAHGSVGTLNVIDGAIVNAKIANLDAGKITTGQLVAARIDSRGLSIKDESGNVILAAGSQLPLAYSNPGTINNNITVVGGQLLGIGAGAGVQVDNSFAAIGQNLVPNSDQTSAITWGQGIVSGVTTGTPLQYASNIWSTTYTLRSATTRNLAFNQTGVGPGDNNAAAADFYPMGGWGSTYCVPVQAGQLIAATSVVASPGSPPTERMWAQATWRPKARPMGPLTLSMPTSA